MVVDLAVGRFLTGVQAGCSLCLLPLFIIEAAPSRKRPFLYSLQQVFQAFSTLAGFLVGWDRILPLGRLQVEWLQIIGVTPTVLFILVLLTMPDTPYCVLERIQEEDFRDVEEKENGNCHYIVHPTLKVCK